MTLDKVRVGCVCTVKKVNGNGEFRYRLLDMGIIPKTLIKVIRYAPMGDPMEVRLRGYDLTLRKSDAALIEVEE